MAAYLVSGLLLFGLGVSLAPAQQTPPMPDLRREDETVVRVVLDRLIFPELTKFGKRVPAPMLLVEDQTITLQPSGKIPDRWHELLKPNPKTGWPGLIADDARRQRVIDSFESRNSRSHELPDLNRSDLMRVPTNSTEVRDRYRDRPLGTTRFSLPGYSLDGYAMILVTYHCGNLCGASWLVILDNTTGNWLVTKTFPLAIS